MKCRGEIKELNKLTVLFKDANGIIIDTPIYYAGSNGTIISFPNGL